MPPVPTPYFQLACPACDVGWAQAAGPRCWVCGEPGVPYSDYAWYITGRWLAPQYEGVRADLQSVARGEPQEYYERGF